MLRHTSVRGESSETCMRARHARDYDTTHDEHNMTPRQDVPLLREAYCS